EKGLSHAWTLSGGVGIHGPIRCLGRGQGTFPGGRRAPDRRLPGATSLCPAGHRPDAPGAGAARRAVGGAGPPGAAAAGGARAGGAGGKAAARVRAGGGRGAVAAAKRPAPGGAGGGHRPRRSRGDVAALRRQRRKKNDTATSAAEAREAEIVSYLRHHYEREPLREGPPRRGLAGQRLERWQGLTAPRPGGEAGMGLQTAGWHWADMADFFHLAPRTLRAGRRHFTLTGLRMAPLGRPIQAAGRDERNDVIHFLDEWGPGVGLPTLQTMFPMLARAELADIL